MPCAGILRRFRYVADCPYKNKVGIPAEDPPVCIAAPTKLLRPMINNLHERFAGRISYNNEASPAVLITPGAHGRQLSKESSTCIA